jgi:hypothetical protein
MIVVFVVAILFSIGDMGKPRRPSTPAVVVAATIIHVVLIWLTLRLAGVL